MMTEIRIVKRFHKFLHYRCYFTRVLSYVLPVIVCTVVHNQRIVGSIFVSFFRLILQLTAPLQCEREFLIDYIIDAH